MEKHARVLIIDNYDSFTFNLVQAVLPIAAAVIVRRNDEITPAEADSLAPTHLIVSPGPGHPDDAGCSIEIIRRFAPRIPVLGVCLGHQAMARAFGGRVGAAKRIHHGKSSIITHDGAGVFAGLPARVEVGRYHSLAVPSDADVPHGFVVTARSESDGEIMAMRHATLPCEGVQFHPESVLTPLGSAMLANFLRSAQPLAHAEHGAATITPPLSAR